MRVAITTALLLSLVSTEASGKQTNSTFKITQPAPALIDNSSNEARYFSPLNQRPATVLAGQSNTAANSNQPKSIRTTQISNGLSSVPSEQPAVPRLHDQLTQPTESMNYYDPRQASMGIQTRVPTSMPDHSYGGYHELRTAQHQMETPPQRDSRWVVNQSPETAVQYLAPTQTPVMLAQPTQQFAVQPPTFSNGNQSPQEFAAQPFTFNNANQPAQEFATQPMTFNNAKSSVGVRNHFFFGVDRTACCDEWAGFSNCGSLKANPGHLGLTWARDDDPCEPAARCQSNHESCQCGDCSPAKHNVFSKHYWKKQ